MSEIKYERNTKFVLNKAIFTSIATLRASPRPTCICTKMQQGKENQSDFFSDQALHGGMTRSYEECNHGCVYYII